MSSNLKQHIYMMPLKQLLKLLETTADDATRSRPLRTHLGPWPDAEKRDTWKYQRASL